VLAISREQSHIVKFYQGWLKGLFFLFFLVDPHTIVKGYKFKNISEHQLIDLTE